jgi:hypothetical protein
MTSADAFELLYDECIARLVSLLEPVVMEWASQTAPLMPKGRELMYLKEHLDFAGNVLGEKLEIWAKEKLEGLEPTA